MAGNYHYQRDSGGRHVTINLDVLSPGAFNLLAKHIERMGVNLASAEARSAASEVVADALVSEVSKVVSAKGAFSDFDGNRITAVVKHRGKSGQYGVTMKSPKKQNSGYPDAVYIEYGYGPAAENPGGIQAMANKARRGKKSLNGYKPGAAFRAGRTARDFRDKKGNARSGWWYYDQWRGGTKRFSRGKMGIAAMYRGRQAVNAMRRNPQSQLNQNIERAVMRVASKGL